jgi:hypothetical protein
MTSGGGTIRISVEERACEEAELACAITLDSLPLAGGNRR